jgi:diguanylate cyclase (GGDEF)-like protein
MIDGSPEAGEKAAPELDRIGRLTTIARALAGRLSLEEMLRLLADGAADLTRAPRASLRLLNPMRTKLIAACRAGAPLHHDPNVVFTVGQGLIGWVAQQHRPLRTGDADHDPRFLPRPDMKEPMGSFLGVPLLVGGTCIGVLSAVQNLPDYFSEQDERHLLLLATMAAPHVDVARLSQLSQIDRLTRARNRLGIDRFLGEGARSDGSLCVAMIDVDHLGLVNDRFGLALGDEVLRGVADRLFAALDPSDVLIRHGGEEFLVVFAASDVERCAQALEQARATIARAPLWSTPPSVTVTVSVGLASRRAGEPREQLVKRAELALGEAKKAGGNSLVRAG